MTSGIFLLTTQQRQYCRTAVHAVSHRLEEVVDRVSALLEVFSGGKVGLEILRQNGRGRDRVYGGWLTRPGGLVGT